MQFIAKMDTISCYILILVVVILLIYFCTNSKSEKFIAKDAASIKREAFRLFDESNGNVTYTDFKVQLPETNAVMYKDYLSMWKQNK